MNKDQPPRYPQEMNSLMTTEHFTLSSARGIINSEISSRINLYFTTLSSVLIAAGFTSQIESNPNLFALFSWTAFPMVILLGFFSIARLMILSGIDMTYIRAINRIRHFYIKAAPEMEEFLLFPPYDDNQSVSSYGGYSTSLRGNLLSGGNAINIANSLLMTIVLGAMVHARYGFSAPKMIPFGIIALAVFYFLHGIVGFLLGRVDRRAEYFEERFPIPKLEEE